MDFSEDLTAVDPANAASLHPLEYLQQLAQQQAMPASVSPSVAPPSLPAKPDTGDGWRGLIHMLAPVLGGVAMGGGPQQTGFLNGYSQGQAAVDEEKRRRALEADKRSQIAGHYMTQIGEQAQQITDPVQFQKFADLADAAFVKAGFGQPGEIKNQLAFPATALAKKQLKELSDQIEGFDKGGYNLDDLASSGAVLTLSTGQHVPIATAIQLTRTRPMDASGKAIPKPPPNKRGFVKVDALVTGDDGKQTRQEINYDPDTGKYTDPDTGVVIPSKSVLKYEKPAGEARIAPGGVDAQYNDLVELWKVSNPGKEPPPAVRTKLREQANKVNDKPQTLGGMNALYGEADPKAIAGAIMRGEREPDTGSLGRPIGAAVDSELAKAGYNKAAAVTDWRATQRHISTLNGPQQLRLNQAINSLPEMLDSVDALASKWKGGRFPLLNKANLALAKGGAYGKDVASAANQLDSQIADVVADLGSVYMGGNSPTDHALGLAAKGLKSEWDERVLHDMVALAKKNVGIRRNSVLNTGVAGASATNPYAKPTETPAAAPSTGKTYQLVNGKWVLQ